MLCKTCHSQFDPEAVLKETLAKTHDEIFWVCIFANDIGAPPKLGSDKKYHLTVGDIRKMDVKGIPVRYFHCSDPVGRVLFGWHIHWVGRTTFACACVATINEASFKAGAPVLLTVACQSSLGTVNCVPDEISITQLGARDDTVGVFCHRESLRDVLTRFRFFTQSGTKPIKRHCHRASGFLGSSMNSSTTTMASDAPARVSETGNCAPEVVGAEQVPKTEESSIAPEGNDAIGKMSEIEDIAQQVTQIRKTLEDQADALNMTRGLLEEAALKSLAELKASEASGERKVRKDIEHMLREGVIRDIDNPDQPNVPHADAVHTLVKYNIESFPNVLAKSFRDAVEVALGETTPSSASSKSNETGDEEIGPSIGTSLVSVRATALRARALNEERGNISPVPEHQSPRLSTLQQTPQAQVSRKRQSPSLQMIHQALSQRLVPGRKRDRDSSQHLPAYTMGLKQREENEIESKIRKVIKDTIHDEIQHWKQLQPPSREEDKEQRVLMDEFRRFLEQRPIQRGNELPAQPHSSPTPTPTQPATLNQAQVQVPPQTQPAQNAHAPVRASGMSLHGTSLEEDTNVTLKDLGIFY